MKELHETAKFRREMKRVRRGASAQALLNLADIFEHLANGAALPPEYKDHALSGDWAGFRDCHIAPDLLLIYQATPTTVSLTRIGSHSELF